MDRTFDDYAAIAASLVLPSHPFIDGRILSKTSGKTIENYNPATGDVIGTIAFAGLSDVDLAVSAARRSFASGVWSRTAPEHRKAVLLRLADLVRQHAVELAVMESLDSGKPIRDCLHEISTEVPTFFQWYGELTDKIFGKVVPTGDSATAFILQEPIGVVGAVLPWNFPLLMAAWKLAPALAAGCSVVLKPAIQTALTTLRLAELATEAGLPDGVLNIVPGAGRDIGEAIGRHPDIDVVTFTGSTQVGSLFLKYAAESNLKPVGLELGGKSPLVVLDDADLSDELIDSAISAAFWNAGQNCSANMRQIVHVKRKDEYVAKLLDRLQTFTVGNPLDPKTDMGPMISDDQRTRVQEYIDSGLQEGANLVSGNVPYVGAGYYLNPTIFDRIDPSMRIAKDEIFGPVLGVFTADSVEHALSLACDTEYGLHATVFTRDIDRALHMARRLPVGTVAINGFTEGDVKTPFGGYRRSGSLARDKGVEAISQYVQTKTIWIRHSPLQD